MRDMARKFWVTLAIALVFGVTAVSIVTAQDDVVRYEQTWFATYAGELFAVAAVSFGVLAFVMLKLIKKLEDSDDQKFALMIQLEESEDQIKCLKDRLNAVIACTEKAAGASEIKACIQQEIRGDEVGP
jgi:cytochrome oxidase Cu insertion factor (SCO1/SenC/PrrC family)